MKNKEKLLQEIYETAFHNEMTYHGCTQAVLAALQEKIDVVSHDVFRAGSAFSGGVARHGETCGALIGAIMAIGALMGRERLPDQEQSQKAMEQAMRVYETFREKIGHTLCSEIHKIRYGKAYRLHIPEERKAFHEGGGHGPQGCPVVCGEAARIAAAVILDLKDASSEKAPS